ncbi:MAG: hypothetical protein AAB917_00360 [Patescibacteria group bacterium]
MNTLKKYLKFSLILIVLFVSIGVFNHADAYVSVEGYYRKNGTYVAPYVRSNPNGLKYDNYSYTPSQGLYNKTYGTRGTTWDTPTYITDPNYYEGKALYESGSSGSSVRTNSVKTQVTAPANAYVYGSSWYCNSGYKQVGSGCEKIIAPANSYVYGSSWYCNSGYKEVGNSCEKVINPANSYVYGSNWYCNSGYKEVGNTCQQIMSPPNSYVYGSNWYCNSGYKEVGNSCEKIMNPQNSYVYGSNWYCNSGYREVDNSCIPQ